MTLRLRPASLLILVLLACTSGGIFLFFLRDTYKPLHRLEQPDYPQFVDDMGLDSLIETAKQQAAYLEKQDPKKKVIFGTESYDNSWLLLSVQQFLAKLQQRPDNQELDQFLKENYILYQAGGRTSQKGRRMLVTGYYEPTFAGSLKKVSPFLYPLYSLPKSLVTLSGEDGKKPVGRYDRDNNFVLFWSRAEIEKDNQLKGYEIVYLKDPFDAFLLHVQGSGKIQLPDNSTRSVRFAGSNGLAYNSIGKLLVDEKIMSLDEVTIPAIRSYLQDHPEELERILHHNPRFIFFSWGDTLPPIGSSGARLTPGRSIAMDNSALPGGTISYLVSRRPEADSTDNITGWTSLNRFVFPQDSGAAIKGTGRVDLFWGSGNYAELASNHMKEEGELYFLVKNPSPK